MPDIEVKDNVQELIESAIFDAATYLKQLSEGQDKIVWFLAGGRVQTDIYKQIGLNYTTKFDWSKLLLGIGDERCVPLHDPQSNWQSISQLLLDRVPLSKEQKLRPPYETAPDVAAREYEQLIKTSLVLNEAGAPRIDYLWLGIGEDGHTMSLFPGHEKDLNTTALVVPVYDSPKPPPDRISLSPAAVTNVGRCLIVCSGQSKAKAVYGAYKGDKKLPVVEVIEAVERGGGQVKWLIDAGAAELL